MGTLNEVEFVAEVKSWVDDMCRTRGPEFPFKRAGTETRMKGKTKRLDFVLYNRQDKIAISGEFKLPDRPDGRNPYAEDLVLDAHEKANAWGAPYFFTSNFNRMVLWETFREGTPIADRDLDYFDWLTVRDADDLLRPEIQERLRAHLEGFLKYLAEIYRGLKTLPRHPLDKRFIHALESALEGPSNLTLTAVSRRCEKDRKFESRVGRWVTSNLGGVFDEESRDQMLESAARFSCYILAIKVVFYDTLRREHRSLPAIRIPKSGMSAAKFQERLKKSFDMAEKVSGDYETVFEGDEFGDALPFQTDEVVPEWISLVQLLGEFNFAEIDYDIIGQIFERLISPQERHRYGQHYTKSEIVDLINAFCIRKSGAVVLDPACGGGTFLVRAYARKKWLEEKEEAQRSHEQRLSEIFGVDVSSYAAHLSVVSLATRNLGRIENYPRVAPMDFFHVGRKSAVFPARVKRKDNVTQIGNVALGTADAIVGNPPYVRQEMLTADQKTEYANSFQSAWPDLKLSGRSDLHIYFWPHAAAFLPEEGGYFGFLTSSSWLDVEYGFALQRWILSNFCIEAIMESSVEPWFTDARVATAVTILRREPDLKRRMSNQVRFVQFRRHLDDIMVDTQHGDERIEAAETLRDRILAAKKNFETKDWRIRVVRQRDLIQSDDKTNGHNHTGGKWGIPLRAPDVFFELTDRFGDRFVRLDELAEVRFGLKSGCDAFFFPRDVTDEVKESMTDAKFRSTYGISKKQTDRLRLCKAGDGTVHVIEAEFLQPEVHSLMEIDSVAIDVQNLRHQVLLVSQPKSALKGKHVLKYIKFGETHSMGRGDEDSPVHKKVSVRSRVTEARPWYDLSSSFRGDMFWPKAQQYRHVVPLNSAGLICSNNLYDVQALPGVDKLLLAAVLNSTVVALSKFQYGRGVGREANLKTEIIDVDMMPVPDPRRLSKSAQRSLVDALKAISQRRTENLTVEFGLQDRQALDLALLEGLGAGRDEAIAVRDRIYAEMTAVMTRARKMELIAQKNRLKSARNGDAQPESLAKENWEDSQTGTEDSE